MFLMGKNKCHDCDVFCEYFKVCENEIMFAQFPCIYFNKKESRGMKNER